MNSWMPRDRRSLRSAGLAGAFACLPFGCAFQADGPLVEPPTYVGRPLPPSNGPATAEAALATVDDDADPCAGDLRDLVVAPGEAVVDLILAPVRMVRTPPWRTVYGPQNDPGLLPGAARGPRLEGAAGSC